MLILNIQVSLGLALLIKGYEPEKICLIFEKRGNPPKSISVLIKTTPSD